MTLELFYSFPVAPFGETALVKVDHKGTHILWPSYKDGEISPAERVLLLDLAEAKELLQGLRCAVAAIEQKETT